MCKACLYIKGRKLRVLIDAGMGIKNLAPIKKMGIDLLILTHCHIDHRLTRMEISDVPVWCHESETVYLKNGEYFLTAMGLKRSGLDLSGLIDLTHGIFDIEIEHEIVDGERIELGGITLVAIHTPGHTPGHLSFGIPEYKLLFSGDIDLTSFGPFYGHDFADIKEFLESIEKLSKTDCNMVATGHAGPFSGKTAQRFNAYRQVVFRRDRLLLEHLKQPRSIEDLKYRNLFYKYYPDPPDLIKWFEVVHIEKHLSRLADSGKVALEGDMWLKRER